MLRRLAVRLSSSANTDNRANGAMLLNAIDRRWGTPDTLGDLLAFLCLEADPDVIDTVVLPTDLQRMAAALDAMSVVALRAPRSFLEYRNLVALLPEAVRSRVGIREGLGELLPSEKLSLIEERLAFVLAQLANGNSPLTDKLGVQGVLLGFTELELLALDCREVLGFREMDEAFKETVLTDEPLLERALRVIEQITIASSEGHHQALHAMADQVLDCLLIPLTFYRPLRNLWPRARQAAEYLCDELGSSKVTHEVPCYRTLIAEIDAGDSHADARARFRRRLFDEGRRHRVGEARARLGLRPIDESSEN